MAPGVESAKEVFVGFFMWAIAAVVGVVLLLKLLS
jgi:hypothetical protein